MSPRKTIRDIQLPSKKTSAEKNSTSSLKKKKKQSNTGSGSGGYTSTYKEHSDSGSSGWGWLFGILILVIGALIIWTVFARATVTVQPRTATADTQADVTIAAQRDAGSNELPYDIVQIQDTRSAQVPATGSTAVEERASGTITIFNKESTSQRFIEETRFETPKGLVFKLPKGGAVTVPASRGGTPGQLEVTVYADEPGEEYNIEPTDFVIPGWREIESPRFETQYARANGPMSGGFVGEQPEVDETEQATATTRLEGTLNQRLTKEIIASVPSEYVVFPELIDFEYGAVSYGDMTDAGVTISKTATGTAVIFEKDEFARVMARELLDRYDNQLIRITNLEELFVSTNQEVATLTGDNLPPEFTVTITGQPEFEWIVDTKVLSENIRGIAKKEFSTQAQEVTGIDTAELTLSPIWAQKVPDEEHITINVITTP